MRRLLSEAEARGLDQRARDRAGIPGDLLMEEAGLRMAEALHRRFPQGSFLVLAGPGHNGGDALVVARHLSQARRRQVQVLAWPKPGTEPSLQFRLCQNLGIPLHLHPSLQELPGHLAGKAAVVDGLFGTGFVVRPGDSWAQVFEAVAASGLPVAALDVPSGLHEAWTPDQPLLRADLTLAVAFAKLSQYLPRARACSGRLNIVPLSFPRTEQDDLQTFATEGFSGGAWLAGSREWQNLVPALPLAAFKTSRGRVQIVGGSPGMTGAVLLAAAGAQAGRAGFVHVAVPETLRHESQSFPPDLLVQVYKQEGLAVVVQPSAVVVVGPGWGRAPERQTELANLWDSAPSLVVDADGLHALAALRTAGLLRPRSNPTVLTPHWGEFSALFGRPAAELMDAPWQPLEQLARETGAVVLLKGADVLAAHPGGGLVVIPGQNPALGVAGAGDVLAGVTGGLLAGGLTPWSAALAAASLHQDAGRRLARRSGFFSASQLAGECARLLGRLQTEVDAGASGPL